MSEIWTQVAERMVDALGVQAGELVQLRDTTGRLEVVQEVLLALEQRGATPLLQLLPPEYLQRLLAATDTALLASWDRRRLAWTETTDRILVLSGAERDLTAAPADALAAWGQAIDRLTHDEERRCIPCLLAAVPTLARAEQLGIRLPQLEDHILPALAAHPRELRRALEPVLAALSQARAITIGSGSGCVLELDISDRQWLSDTGDMSAADRLAPGTQAVLNLPSGALYTTVVETATHGALWLPEALGAHDVTLRFEGGRVVAIEAARGADQLRDLFDRHTGEPRRISHIGIGLNPYLADPIGWTLVDEHCYGAVLVAFGENRYLGGQNASSLNVDVSMPSANLFADQRAIVRQGRLAVGQ
jgi:leucyl aminopeptidase (aminopeptidase T)